MRKIYACMVKGIIQLTVTCTCLLFSSCDMFDYNPYDARVTGKTDINASNIKRIESACKGKDTIRFVTMGDSQRWYDETVDFVSDLNKRNDIDFVIHGGDMSDFGATDEFLWQRDIMEGLNVPYVVILGNHDCIGTGEEVYANVFGVENFSFIAGRIKFVCLNTNALEYDYSHPVPDFNFMKEEVSSRSNEYDRTVVSMHACPTSDQFNNNVADVFDYYIHLFPNLLFCTAAHDHRLYEEDFFGNGTMYYMSTCMKDRCYYVFTITPDGYEKEVVYY